MTAQACILVSEQSQVGEARRAAAKLAEAAQTSETRRGEVAIVVTELATNLVRYGQQGRVLLQTLALADGPCLEIVAVDSGPGIEDLRNSLRDGVSGGGTSGNGLGAVRRLSDEFDAYSTPGKGTVVMSRLRLGGGSSPRQSGYAVGAVSIAAPNETVCGDRWCVAETAGEMAVMVVDGLGHGALAAEAAERVAAAFYEDPFADDASFFQRAHRMAASSRGAAVAVAHLSAGGMVRYAGLGNIAGTVVGADRHKGLPSQNGTVGKELRRVTSTSAEWPDRGVLVMHSDGVSARWTLTGYPGLTVRHPAVIANILCRDFLRGRDDATVVVIGTSRET